MGWTTINYEDEHGLFKDFDVWTLRHFFLEESKAFDSSDRDAAEMMMFFKQWDWLGPGVIVGTDLGFYVRNSASRKEMLLDLFARTIERLQGFGTSIPLSYLDAHVNEPGRSYTMEQSVEPFTTAIKQMSAWVEKGTQ